MCTVIEELDVPPDCDDMVGVQNELPGWHRRKLYVVTFPSDVVTVSRCSLTAS